MNGEKNNFGVNNNLPPMGSIPMENNVNGNIGNSNNLPMGTVSSGNTTINNNSNIHDKYGLPPISNFTNFNTGYETSSLDNNTSVFDLMYQFETVNSNVNINNSGPAVVNSNLGTNGIQQQVSNVQNMSVTNQTSMPNLSNQMPVMEQSQMNNPQLNNNSNQIVAPNINVANMNNVQNGFNNPTSTQSINNSGVVNNQDNISMPSIPVLNQNVNGQFNNEPLNMFSGISDIKDNQSYQPNESVYVENGVSQAPSNVMSNNNLNRNSEGINSLNMFDGIVNDNQVNVNSSADAIYNFNNSSINNQANNPVVKNTPNISNSSDANSLEKMINESDTNFNEFEQDSDIVNSNNSISNNGFESQVELNNIEKTVEIPTTSIDDVNNGVDENISDNNDMSEQISTFNNNIVNENNNNKENVEKSSNNDKKDVVEPKKKKKHKFLFAILFIITILIVAAIAVLSYFMFFKTDKLVCNIQDYSSEEYLIEESFVYRFKGNNITSGKRTQSVMFTEDNVDKKNSYLEELKNQYQGLGFNVSFVENETGFDINMDFTKSELESWYGQKFKNYSKAKLKKEMRESGYTCK